MSSVNDVISNQKMVGQITEGGIWDEWLDHETLHKLINHPLMNAMKQNTVSMSGIRYYLVQHHHYSRNFTRFLCALISKIDNLEDSQHLMENLLEELGIDGDGKVTHAELFQRSLRAVGGQPNTYPALEETKNFASTVMQYCRNDGALNGLAALCLGAEAIVPMIYEPVLSALTSLEVEEEGLEFFRLHIEEDEDHAITMLNILNKLTNNDEKLIEQVKRVGCNTILLRCKMFDAIYERIQKESSEETDSYKIFELHESNVRSYCRTHSTIFDVAKNDKLYNNQGEAWIDFLSGAGSLNYGHNNQSIKKEILDYIERDGITLSLDLYTSAKRKFIDKFNEVVLTPRNYEYKFQFTGPTGTNAVEAALKLARKVTGRTEVVAFTNAFHGMSLGALAATARDFKRTAAGVSLNNIIRLPYDKFLGEEEDSYNILEKMLLSSGSGLNLPAAIILETIQGEGGVNVASKQWLNKIEKFCKKNGVLLIIDDVQMGCGRTGTFFSFENAGIEPDIICLAKSISGYGLPMSLVLLKPELDKWLPAEHNGTFRGNNLAFIGATKALDYWTDVDFLESLRKKSKLIENKLMCIAENFSDEIVEVRGKGMIWGIECKSPDEVSKIIKESSLLGLVIESCGSNNNTVKILPPLTILEETLIEGLRLLEKAFQNILTGK
ncbi:diaminobutyrate--2-oxoglutarate transaminase [Kosakonia sp. MUSA4]|uniref:diaminobutyrate--2-oxoglutarate transaminase n=1 Tax=Kosakonia sp. MUSA4 TaxID=2067958 RepID=UPI001C252A18|nr:diaminobutyrate--2-oxoglutarate transaminase [Kosakonia sp. MUSA4]